ncbi:MAG TPA: hypothetical protein VKK31_15695 [Thermoanaerobaculia bacterium]|nr:hypothetical protein [Thermoanaerobaculia bacterium]
MPTLPGRRYAAAQPCLDRPLVADSSEEPCEPSAERGRFHLAGTLYSKAGEPVGYAQAAANLEPGRQWIELSYYGLMFHDRQVAGPYRLGSLAFSTTTQMPNALNDLVENAYVTRPYRLRQMREAAFERPQLLETAKRLEIDAERAEREARERTRQ